MNLSSLRIQLSTAAVLALTVASANALTVTDVSARQRWPWNSLVDVDFTIGDAAEGEAFAVEMTATYDNGTKTIYAKTFATEPIAATGPNRVAWDIGADYPDFRAEDLQVSVTATPLSDSTPVYLVVDLTGGSSATKYPVRYTTSAPTMTVGENDPCKTTELWLRRIKAKNVSHAMGANNAYDNYYYGPYTCTFTNDYYIGIFPLTQAQVYNIKGEYYSYFANKTCNATRPMDAVNFNTVRSTTLNYPPRTSAKTGDTILKRLEDRTALPFDLPTEFQWEYAMRAGKSGAMNGMYSGGTTLNLTTWNSYGSLPNPRNAEADTGTCYVDYGNPNAWGIYLVFNNVAEWCLNRKLSMTANESCYDKGTEAVGTGNTYTQYQLRGIATGSNGQYTGLQVYRSSRGVGIVNNYTTVRFGARVCLTID